MNEGVREREDHPKVKEVEDKGNKPFSLKNIMDFEIERSIQPSG